MATEFLQSVATADIERSDRVRYLRGSSRRRSRHVGWLVGSGLAAGVVIAFPLAASAAFPGVNGSVVYQSTESGISPCSPFTSPELFSVPSSGGSSTQVDCNGNTDQHPFVAPDGAQVVFASNRAGGSGAFQLFTQSLSSPGTAVDVSYPPGAGVDDYPSWAPASPANQGPIIFQRTLPGGVPQLYTENVNTPSVLATPVFSTPTGFSDTEPVYDPSNANEILFVRQAVNPSRPQQIYEYDLATPSIAPIDLSAADGDATSNDSKPDFAPSAVGLPAVQEVVFQSDRSTANALGGPCAGTQLYTMTDQAGSPIAPVFQSSGQQVCPKVGGVDAAVEDPVFSPQGNAIAFDEPGPNTQNLYTYEISFSNDAAVMSTMTDLTPNFATDVQPSWGPVAPGASTPEAPVSVLLPLAGVGMFGAAGLFVARKRHRASA